jgi:hypothetical protein
VELKKAIQKPAKMEVLGNEVFTWGVLLRFRSTKYTGLLVKKTDN